MRNKGSLEGLLPAGVTVEDVGRSRWLKFRRGKEGYEQPATFAKLTPQKPRLSRKGKEKTQAGLASVVEREDGMGVVGVNSVDLSALHE
ncbi:hypothetical protein PSPO01_06165 [Paraphaeosphaeria sporulosa]